MSKSEKYANTETQNFPSSSSVAGKHILQVRRQWEKPRKASLYLSGFYVGPGSESTKYSSKQDSVLSHQNQSLQMMKLAK